MAELAVRIAGARPAFVPRARWVLGILAEALGREARFTDGPADLVYAPDPSAEGTWIPADLVYAPEAPAEGPGGTAWIPADPAAQAFFEGTGPFPGASGA